MRLLSLPSVHSSIIKPSDTLKKDIIPWTLAASVIVTLFALMGLLITAALPIKANYQDGLGVLYSNILLVMALVTAGCITARRRPKDVWTWALALLVIFIYVPQNHMTISVYLSPNGILQAMVGMIGLLAVGRIFEYFYVRDVVKLQGIFMPKSTIAIYGVLAIVCYLMNSSRVFEMIYKIINS